MAWASPRARLVSKNAVSPIPTATTTEMASSARFFPDIADRPDGPVVTSTHPRISTAPSAERTALSVTELKLVESERTRRPITAQVSAEPVAQRTPRPDSESAFTEDPGLDAGVACVRSDELQVVVPVHLADEPREHAHRSREVVEVHDLVGRIRVASG